MLTSQVKLNENQNKRFDTDYIGEESFKTLHNIISEHAHEIRNIADFGGGNGHFIDRILSAYPESIAENYEISDYLRSQNSEHPRKKIIAESFLAIQKPCEYDIVFLNWVLHHMVGRNIRQTRNLICRTLTTARNSLRNGGMLVIAENIINSFFPQNLSSRLLFLIGKSRLLMPITERLGANTAGTGIYYMSERELMRMVPAGFIMVSKLNGNVHNYGRKVKLLGIRNVTERFYIFQKMA